MNFVDDLLHVRAAFHDFEHDIKLFIEINFSTVSLANQFALWLYLVKIDPWLVLDRFHELWIVKKAAIKGFDLFVRNALPHTL